MKFVGVVSKFVVAAMLVVCSRTAALPPALSFNVDIFKHTGLNDACASVPAQFILEEAERILNDNYVFGTIFQLLVPREAGTFKCDASSDSTCITSTIEEGSTPDGADIYVFFANGSKPQAHQDLEGKVCHPQSNYRTVLLPCDMNNIYSATRKLVFYIGRLLGMRNDVEHGRKAKDRITDCGLGNMDEIGAANETWNQCNKEDLEGFYQAQIAKEPWGLFCLDKNVKILIAIDAFYDKHFAKNFGKDQIWEIVHEAEDILNEKNQLEKTFHLMVVHEEELDDIPLHLIAPIGSGQDEIASISWKKGSSAANLFVFFTEINRRINDQLRGNICSDDRSLRTVTVTQQDYNVTGAARQLVFFIGNALGMQRDDLRENPEKKCEMGNMDLWTDWDEKKNWNQCNVDDLSAFYANKPGKQFKRLCVASAGRDLTINIDTMHTKAFLKKAGEDGVDEKVRQILIQAENTLNQDPIFAGTTYQLASKRSSSFMLPQKWTSFDWTSRPEADLYLVFDQGDYSWSFFGPDSHICTASTEEKRLILRRNSYYGVTAMGNQLAYYIGRMLGMKRVECEQTASDGTVCQKSIIDIQVAGTLGEKERRWAGKQSWNKCNVEDMWKSYYKIVNSEGSFCLDKTEEE